MKSLSRIIVAICFVFFGSNLRAQITNSEESAAWLAAKIAISSGGTADQHLVYARSLAKTLSQFSLKEQGEILGEIPSSDGTGTGGTPPPLDLMGAIDDDKLAPVDLLLALLEAIPLDEDVLTAALERTPSLEDGHLNDLLTAQGKVSNGYMVSRLTNSKDNLSSSALKSLIIANSPVKSVVLKKVASTTKMTAADKAAVLAAQ